MDLQIRRYEQTSSTSEQFDQQSASSMANSAGELAMADLIQRVENLTTKCNDLDQRLKEVEEDRDDLLVQNRLLRTELHEAQGNALNSASSCLDEIFTAVISDADLTRLNEAAGGALSKTQAHSERLQEVMREQIHDIGIELVRKEQQYD